MKKHKVSVVIIAIAIIASILVGCNGLLNKKYFKEVAEYEF